MQNDSRQLIRNPNSAFRIWMRPKAALGGLCVRRSWQTWLYFGVCLALLLAAMAQVSLMALDLDRKQAEARRNAEKEERIRLAMWRMESSLMPLVGRESARPHWDYRPFYPAQRAYTRLFNIIEEGEVLVPSPLLTGPPLNILLHFQFDPQGRLTSPQVPLSNMRDLAEARYTTQEKVALYAGRLRKLRDCFNRTSVLRRLRPTPASEAREIHVARRQSKQRPQTVMTQRARNILEYQRRVSSAQEAVPELGHKVLPRKAGPRGKRVPGKSEAEVSKYLAQSILAGGRLVLARRSYLDGRVYVQGCWLDWPKIKTRLLKSIHDLLPNADLALKRKGTSNSDHAGPAAGGGARTLAVIGSVQLIPGAVPHGAESSFTPIRISLIFAWVCVLVAAGAVGVLLKGTLALSERRADFVSAVTHELRTPLTTFRMYAEMLAEGMVRDGDKRRRYLETLRAEADRLHHLVENVLAFARLERGRHGTEVASVSVEDLLGRVRERLEQRAARAEMRLAVDEGQSGEGLAVRADAAAVEHILFNLVDNACKYAAAASNRHIRLDVCKEGGFVTLRVRDYGPGIGAEARGALFKPFSKSARDAAGSAPGIGLGLSLSRRLARGMSGDLYLDTDVRDGACFVLKLPQANAA